MIYCQHYFDKVQNCVIVGFTSCTVGFVEYHFLNHCQALPKSWAGALIPTVHHQQHPKLFKIQKMEILISPSRKPTDRNSHPK